MGNNFKCGYCDKEFPVNQRGGKWFFDNHKIAGTYFACEGIVLEALETVHPADFNRLTEFLEKQRETGRKSPKTSNLKDIDDSIQREFEEYHRNNPKVYAALVNRAKELKRQGYTHYSMAALWEWLRHHTRTESNGFGANFKFSNNHRSRYSRLLMEQEPELEGFFELRELTAR